MKEIKHIFFVSTPLHLKIVDLIKPPVDTTTIIDINRKCDIKSAKRYTMINIDLCHIPKIPLVKHFIAKKRIDEVLTGMHLTRSIEIYYPNDHGMEYQFALSYFKMKLPEAKMNMFEDGIGSHINRDCFKYLNITLKRKIKVGVFSFLFGDRYINKGGFRTTLADAYFGFPPYSFLEERNNYGKAFRPIHLDNSIFLPASKVLDKKKYILLTSCMVEDKILDRNQWYTFVTTMAEVIAGKTETVYIKPHPRESSRTVEELHIIFDNMFKEVIYIKGDIAIEDYISQVHNKEKLFLYATLSSSLFYSKLFFPEVNVHSFPFPENDNLYLNCYAKSFNTLMNFESIQKLS